VSVKFLNAGDLAVQVEFDEPVSPDLNRRVLALDFLLGGGRVAGVVETVPAFRSLLVYYDPRIVRHADLCASIESALTQTATIALPPARHIELPCCYDDPELGFELAAAAEKLRLSPAALVELQSQAEYPVYFIGFAPGQPYLAGLPERLAIPRLETPRTKTPVGSVGIGGTQACVYSTESPGGFWVLGRTPVRLYDPEASEPILLRAGDCVRFTPITRAGFDRIENEVRAGSYRVRIA